jgi:hypothetical protein
MPSAAFIAVAVAVVIVVAGAVAWRRQDNYTGWGAAIHEPELVTEPDSDNQLGNRPFTFA